MRAGDEMRAKLEAEMMAGKHAAALRQLTLVMTGMMRGEKAVALQAIRLNIAADCRNMELAAMQAQGQLQMHSAAMREMRAVMTRLAKGEVAMRVEIWRSGKVAAVLKASATLRVKLAAELKAQGQSGALRQIQTMMVGIMRGVVGKVVWLWRESMVDALRAKELEAAKGATALLLLNTQARALKVICWKMIKGEKSFYVEQWKSNRKIGIAKELAASEAQQDLMNEIRLLRIRNKALMEEMVQLQIRAPPSNRRK